MFKKYTTDYVMKHYKDIGLTEDDAQELANEYEYMWLSKDLNRVFVGDDVGILWEDNPCQYCPSSVDKDLGHCKDCDVYKDLVIKGGK